MTNSEPLPSQGLIGGKYELVRLIGRGGMGSVWEARHASLGTPSAIKFIESEYADSHEARSRFNKEAKAVAMIQSKHAIQIYDHGVTTDGKPYIVMELLQGEPLDHVIDRGPISLYDTAKILQQVCRGLVRAHERGIIHRDLKPENIFLVKTPDDEDVVAKVIDFGIAKMQGENAPGLTSSTKTGAVLGTPFYMAPEQARGLRNVDHRADIWSLGVIAFKCVTGKLPFDGESVGDLLVKICTSPIPVPSQFAASLGIHGIPPAFDGWFMRALEREPERRYPTVVQLADDLCAAAGIQRQHSGPVSVFGAHPSTVGSPASGGSPPQSHYGAMAYVNATPTPEQRVVQAPTPAAMTNAPFTREDIGAAPSKRGRLVVTGVLTGILAVAAVVGVVFVLRRPLTLRSDPASAVGMVSPSVSVAPPSSASAEPPAPPSPPPLTKNAEGSSAAVAPAPAPPPPKPAGKVSPSKPVVPVVVTTAKPPLTPPLPAPTPTPTPSPPAKKPNKNDPGY